ncbi:ABC transporter permease subunit [Salipaludibacillus sp. CUR1]|uniref:ABC transporter permease n=1 Tax=Salipaludibacillus sp. CUR1 TaxID=2820003 RepID=UPI001E596706|nr:ABC transporter permease subunit [Salipaludibacillus sp. CUR1]MCE7792662.1 ABC transporter permease subunit [Salipaludibacillus sp. CUR1]
MIFNRKKAAQAVWFTGCILLFVAPVVIMFIKSVSFGWSWPEWRPDQFSLRAWEVMFRDPALSRSLYVTVAVGVSVVLINFLIAVPSAYALSRFSFKGKGVVEALLMMPILIPVLAIAMGMHLTMIRLGLTDRITGVILIHLLPTLPYAVRVLKAGFDRLSFDWEEQSAVLGAGRWTTFWTVVVPLIIPSLRSTAVLVFVISLSQYVLTAIIGGGKVLTLPMIYYPYFNSADEAVVAGFSVLFALLPIAFLIVWEAVIKGYLFVIRKP